MRLSLELKKGVADYTGVFPGDICVGFLDTATADPNGLDAAIAFAMEGGFEEPEGRTAELEAHLSASMYVSALRHAVSNNDWATVEQLTAEGGRYIEQGEWARVGVHGVTTAPDHLLSTCEDEVDRITREMGHYKVCKLLWAALAEGGAVRGSIDSLDLSAVNCEELREAVETSRQTGTESIVTQNLLADTDQLMQVRDACFYIGF